MGGRNYLHFRGLTMLYSVLRSGIYIIHYLPAIHDTAQENWIPKHNAGTDMDSVRMYLYAVAVVIICSSSLCHEPPSSVPWIVYLVIWSDLSHADVFEPVGPAVLLVQP